MRDAQTRPRRALTVVLAGLTVGVLAAWLVFGRQPPSRDVSGAEEPSVTALVLDREAAPPQAAGPSVDGPAGVPAGDPGRAVEQFLSAEVDGDFASSWKLLAAADRARYRSLAGWVKAHADFAPITGFQLGDAEAGDDRVVVPSEVRLRAGLDEVTGLTPARADATWIAVAEQGGWSVAFSESSLLPVLPPDTDAPGAVLRWAQGRQSCAPAGERAVLLGTAPLAEQLCGATGEVRVGSAGALAAAQLPAFVSAFGPEVADWARTVEVERPVPLVAVVAPVDDDWVVIGVLQPSTTGGG